MTQSGHSVEYAVQQVDTENQGFAYPVDAPPFPGACEPKSAVLCYFEEVPKGPPPEPRSPLNCQRMSVAIGQGGRLGAPETMSEARTLKAANQRSCVPPIRPRQAESILGGWEPSMPRYPELFA